MNMAEYSKALSKLPMTFKVKPHDEVKTCLYRDKLVIVHHEVGMMYYKENDWHKVDFAE